MKPGLDPIPVDLHKLWAPPHAEGQGTRDISIKTVELTFTVDGRERLERPRHGNAKRGILGESGCGDPAEQQQKPDDQAKAEFLHQTFIDSQPLGIRQLFTKRPVNS